MTQSATATTVNEQAMTSQQRANRKQNEKRKEMHRLPSAYLDDAENALVTRLGKVAGNKRAAIFAGLRLLEEQYINEGKLKPAKKKA